MRKLLILSAFIATPALAAAPTEPACHPTQPTPPVNSEDNNPGLGSATGLNSDWHQKSGDSLDVPGSVIHLLAQSDGGISVLTQFVGNDCRDGGRPPQN